MRCAVRYGCCSAVTCKTYRSRAKMTANTTSPTFGYKIPLAKCCKIHKKIYGWTDVPVKVKFPLTAFTTAFTHLHITVTSRGHPRSINSTLSYSFYERSNSFIQE
ncbi:hypothetical protein Q1695_000709 [Nippostrongylus brasiliensis]|nr:hypothetical protein Q1695_000709 [Nippostrongylus brasiliensis]